MVYLIPTSPFIQLNDFCTCILYKPDYDIFSSVNVRIIYACLIHGVCISVDPDDTSGQDLGKDIYTAMRMRTWAYA